MSSTFNPDVGTTSLAFEHMGLFRFTRSGQLDVQFGTAGVVATTQTALGYDSSSSVICGGGKLAVTGASGYSWGSRMVTWQFDEAGAVDADFGEGGHLAEVGATPIYSNVAAAAGGGRILRDAEGRVLVVGVQTNEQGIAGVRSGALTVAGLPTRPSTQRASFGGPTSRTSRRNARPQCSTAPDESSSSSRRPSPRRRFCV